MPPGTFSDTHIARLRRVHGRVLPAAGLMTASLLYSTRFANEWYAASAITLTLALFAGTVALMLWPHRTLYTLRITVFALLLGLNAGVFGSYMEAIHGGLPSHLQLSGSLYGVSIVILVVHTLFTPLGARFVGLAVWIGTTFVALAGLALYWTPAARWKRPSWRRWLCDLGRCDAGIHGDLFAAIDGPAPRRGANSLLEYRANTDVLPNAQPRRVSGAKPEGIRLERRQDSPMSLITIDIDCFKAINDLYGHDAGDRVLQQVARVIR